MKNVLVTGGAGFMGANFCFRHSLMVKTTRYKREKSWVR